MNLKTNQKTKSRGEPGARPLQSEPGARPLQSEPGARPLQSEPGARPLQSHELRMGILLVTALTLIFGVVNWLWLRANVISYGWDRAGHLVRSFVYNDIFRDITPTTFFKALIASHYYPPLVPFTAALSYQFFGVSEDVGVMVNVFYLALLLGAVWSIGRRLGGLAVANLATLVIGTFPMIYAMSRYFYLDFALTSLVAVTLALLLASEHFTRRVPSLFFGFALGASFLIKWTTAAFVAFPLLFILWRGIGANITGWASIRASARASAKASARLASTFFRPHWGRLMLSLLIGIGIAGLLLLPARDLVAQQAPFGLWLIPLFALLIAAAIYALLTRDTNPAKSGKVTGNLSIVLTNALSAGAIAALTLSLWYLPNFNFIYGFMEIAYGSETGSGRQLVYGEYLENVIVEQLGVLYTLMLVIALFVLLWGFLRQKSRQVLDDTQIVLILWAIVPFLIFTSNVSVTKSRYVMPFLPPFALWIALGLWRLPPKFLRSTVIRVVMLLAWVQFAIISFDALDGLRDNFVVETPIGKLNLLANGFFIQYPAMERTDLGFNVVPQILARIEEGRQASGDELVKLCIIVNTQQINNDHFLVDIYLNFPKILLSSVVENKSGKPTYPKLFDMDYVLLTTDYANEERGIEEASVRASERILSKPDDLFNRAYRQVEQWLLPNGETYILYERRFTDTEPGLVPETYHKLMQEMGAEFGEKDSLILSAPDQSYIMGLLLPEESAVSLLPLPSDGASTQETIAALKKAAQEHKRLFLLSHNSNITDPEGRIEAWLRGNTIAGVETWIDSLRVSAFIPYKNTPELLPINATFGNNGPTLEAFAFDRSLLQPGDALTGALFWGESEADNLKVSLQLISPEGSLVSQQDTSLTTGLQPLALLIPRDIRAGNYRLMVSVYTDPAQSDQPQSSSRLTLADGRDVLELGEVKIGE